MEIDGLRLYFGGSSGSAHKALRQVEEPHVMLSAVTENNRPWDTIDTLFVDSGGYSLMLDTGEHPPATEYLDTVERMGADKFAFQDYPCEPEILAKYGRSVEQHQQWTTDRARENLDAADDRGLDGEPIAVLQGWKPDQYVAHFDALRDAGCLTDMIAIGSVCRRGGLSDIRAVIRRVRDVVPDSYDLHAFGVKYTVLGEPDIRDALTSVDTGAWYKFHYEDALFEEKPWRTCARRYFSYVEQMHELIGTEAPGQSVIGEFV